jgi:hypothetical protein
MNVITHRSVLGSISVPKIDRTRLRVALLICGAASTALYFGMDLVASLLYDDYSYKGQTISELSAIGAPTRSMWIPLGFVYAVLVIAGGLGIWASAGKKRTLRIVAALVTAVGVVGLVAWPFAPMHQREVLAAGGATWQDELHRILGFVDMSLFMLMIAIGATALGRRFLVYSIATIVAVLVFGGLMGLDSPNVADNQPTPWIGVTERIAVFGSMLWISVLAIVLLRETQPDAAATAGR